MGMMEDPPSVDSAPTEVSPQQPPTGTETVGSLSGADELAKVFGIEIVALHTTAAGEMLDLRYRVIDPKLAAEITKRNTNLEMHIIDVKTGTVLNVPITHLGALRNRTPKPKAKRIYYALFDNTGAVVKKGSEVSIQVGQVKVDGMRVQ
jgi:hypothetical protein